MKELVWAINKSFYFNKSFIGKVKSPMVLSKRSLIHSDGFQSKIKSYLKLFLVGSKLKTKAGKVD